MSRQLSFVATHDESPQYVAVIELFAVKEKAHNARFAQFRGKMEIKMAFYAEHTFLVLRIELPTHDDAHIFVVEGEAPPSATEIFNALVKRMNEELQSRISARSKTAQEQSKSGQDGIPSGWEFEFDVTFNEQKWVFNAPTITFKTQTWSFDLPEVRTKEASFDVPDTLEWHIEHRYLGDFLQCRKITDCGMYPAYTDVQVAVMRSKTVKLTVPDVVMQRKEFKWDVPEFGLQEVTWIVKVPEFKLVRAAATYSEEAKKKAEQIEKDTKSGISQDVSEIRNKYKDELLKAASGIADEARKKMTDSYNVNIAFYDGAIDAMGKQINALAENQRQPYVEQLNKLITERKAFADQYVAFMQNIDSQIQNMVQHVIDSIGAASEDGKPA